MNPSYELLAAAYRGLLSASLRVNDKLRKDVDRYTFDGSMNDVEDLREEVNRHLHDWLDFIYPEND